MSLKFSVTVLWFDRENHNTVTLKHHRTENKKATPEYESMILIRSGYLDRILITL